jgi:hypothetical protein
MESRPCLGSAFLIVRDFVSRGHALMVLVCVALATVKVTLMGWSSLLLLSVTLESVACRSACHGRASNDGGEDCLNWVKVNLTFDLSMSLKGELKL